MKSIKVGDNNLIDYSYDDNGLTIKRSYGNQQNINYLYDTDKNKASIKQNDNILYIYIYDEYGALKSIKDSTSNRIIVYSIDADDVSVTEETGDGVYHKFYSKENKSVEMIGDKTYTTLVNNPNKKYWLAADNIYSTYLKKTDKFERTSSESMYKALHDSGENDIESFKKILYNKEYNYITSGENATSEFISKLKYTGGYNRTINYGYDKNGKITRIGNDVYVYDEAGQLWTIVKKVDKGTEKIKSNSRNGQVIKGY